ncbi:MAG: sigma-70 family RNA polymerase sigma factor [Polyangiales bacterium]
MDDRPCHSSPLATLPRDEALALHGVALRAVRCTSWALHRHDVEELAQQALANTLARGPSPANELGAYVCRAAQNLARKRHRSESRRRAHVRFGHELGDVAPESAAPSATPTVEPRLEAALLALPERDATILRLRYVDDATFDEVGAAVGLSARTAQNHHDRALASLRRTLGVGSGK